MRVRVKICGITSVADALAAAEAGADAIGLNFAVGPRRIEPEAGGQIAAALPPFVTAVALFVNAQAETIRAACAACGIGTVQLHGEEAPDLVAALRPLRVIKAFRVATRQDVQAAAEFCRRCSQDGRPAALLLDARVEGVQGGTGQAFDWRLAAEARPIGRVILAGGLGPDNVAEAICVARPYAVDASSRLESAPGRKDHRLMREFVAAVRAAERSRQPSAEEPAEDADSSDRKRRG
jgi:phosphoribosylanthranilate isomerase